MTGLGGFLPLEIPSPAPGAPYHLDAAATVASGRASWHLVLRARRPSRVFLPFYVCDAMLTPLLATGTPFELYAIDESFRPAVDLSPAPDELVLLVNYFGAMTSVIDTCVAAQPDTIVVDDTQAFFRRGLPGAWSFNSVRKFFGVPDGAFLYAPPTHIDPLPPSDLLDCDHLIARLEGDDDGAWEQFKAREARVGIEPRAMSVMSRRLLGSIDMEWVRSRRETNFVALHEQLGALNRIGLPLEDVAADGPLCYPFLVDRDPDRAELSRRGVFVATFWPELGSRCVDGFEWERSVARRLLPLPIDHRYDPDDMKLITRTVLDLLR